MSFSKGFNNLWTPEAVPSWSGCEPSCNNCGNACPTGAIRALPLPEKRAARMGLAIVNEQTCLPYAGKEACQLCVDECTAAGYNAIEFKRVGTEVDAEGLPIEDSGFKAPVVLADKCVGCGLCETRCSNTNFKTKHLLDKSAIIVHAGEGKEDRMHEGSYIQLAADRQKAKLQSSPGSTYNTDF
jgi:NAD-dependent dihydropyrimidine dehydrogenase PreA subunit